MSSNSAIMKTSGLQPKNPIYKAYPLFTRLSLALQIWSFKIFVVFGLKFLRAITAAKVKAVSPTYTKRYPSHPDLECRVFHPPSAQPGTKLPLYINIHGGGFSIGDPQIDDEFCHKFSTIYGFCVVSLNYRKAPSFPFPTPVHDCADLAQAVITDPDLPIDASRVVLGGFSAGANLTLAIAQLPGIQNKVKALIPIYPATDFSGTFKGEFRTNKNGRPDKLTTLSRMFNYAYINPGQDLTDPLLSVVYADRVKLPQSIFFIGAEYDVLCREAHVMARMLAGVDHPEDVAFDAAPVTWSRNGIKWMTVPDMQHGFTHEAESDVEEEAKRRNALDDMYKQMADWLKDEVFVKE